MTAPLTTVVSENLISKIVSDEGGSIDNTTIGTTTPAAGAFTTASANVSLEALTSSVGTSGGSPALFSGATALSVQANPSLSGNSTHVTGLEAVVQTVGTITNTNQVVSNLFYGLDSLHAPTATSVANVANYHQVSASVGSRISDQTSLTVTANTDDVPGNQNYFIAQAVNALASGNFGGTSGSNGGQLFGSNITSTIGTGVQYVNGVSGLEVDVSAQAGSSVGYKGGFAVVLQGGDAVESSVHPSTAIGIGLNVDSPSSHGWGQGLVFGGPAGWWPMNVTTGIMIYADPLHYAGGPALACASGIDFSAITFSNYFLKSAGFTVDGSGNVAANALQVGNSGNNTPAISFVSNENGAYPAQSFGGAIGANFSSGNKEVDFWNTNTSPTSSFYWFQQTGTSSRTFLMGLSPTGALNVSAGFAAWGVTPPASKPTITGSRGSATATVLESILQALQGAGLLTDSTTA